MDQSEEHRDARPPAGARDASETSDISSVILPSAPPTATRREFLGGCSATLTAGLSSATAVAAPGCNAAAASTLTSATDVVRIDPAPLFPISPYLYMQFMEPLGVTDSSVEASWDVDADDWRRDFLAATADLAPGAIRWGGLLSRYYKWREGVGPPERRLPMRNYVWGGRESNRVGTREFVDLCRRTGAAPLLCVNFLGDGRQRYARTREGNRTGDAQEAADWVSYANDPDDPERRRHGAAEPYGVKLWQIGNETSYGADGFTRDEAIAHTGDFARAMKARDPSISLIGWGDGDGSEPASLWAGDLVDRAGEHLDLVAIHMMQQLPTRPDTLLRGRRYQDDPARAWAELVDLSHGIERRLVALEQVLDQRRTPPRIGIAVTEGHLSLAPHNANAILTEWMTGVYHARAMNIYQRHGDRVRIATAADFNGTRWTTVAVMLPVPRGSSYLLPAGAVMRLFKRHNGGDAVAVRGAPADLDIAASRSADRLFLHVANLAFDRSVAASFAVDSRTITGGRVIEIAPDDVRRVVSQDEPNVFEPKERPLGKDAGSTWRFPAASVSAVELDLA
jgi:alpha-L-arabinofuranosidase